MSLDILTWNFDWSTILISCIWLWKFFSTCFIGKIVTNMMPKCLFFGPKLYRMTPPLIIQTNHSAANYAHRYQVDFLIRDKSLDYFFQHVYRKLIRTYRNKEGWLKTVLPSWGPWWRRLRNGDQSADIFSSAELLLRRLGHLLVHADALPREATPGHNGRHVRGIV